MLLRILAVASTIPDCAPALNVCRKLYPYIKNPEVVAPITVHPAFEKAAHYFDLKMVHIPLDDTFHVDMNAMRRAINRNTILLVGSAPQYCYGVRCPRRHKGRLCGQRSDGFSGWRRVRR